MFTLMSRESQPERPDPVTGLPDRQHFYEVGREELSMAQRFGIEIGLLLIQIDHFEDIVNVHGESVANQVLRKLVKYIDAAIGSR